MQSNLDEPHLLSRSNALSLRNLLLRKIHQTEFELSPQENAADPPDSAYALMIPSTDPYVPATVRKLPISITNILQQTFGNQYFELLLPFDQLSYSHMHPIGWKHMVVPSNAPIRETKESKTGIVLAIM